DLGAAPVEVLVGRAELEDDLHVRLDPRPAGGVAEDRVLGDGGLERAGAGAQAQAGARLAVGADAGGRLTRRAAASGVAGRARARLGVALGDQPGVEARRLAHHPG